VKVPKSLPLGSILLTQTWPFLLEVLRYHPFQYLDLEGRLYFQARPGLLYEQNPAPGAVQEDLYERFVLTDKRLHISLK